MYSQKFWDNIYINHYSDAPWMDDTWKGNVLKTVKEKVSLLVGKSNKPLSLLDYGCGNGYMGLSFCEEGMNVDITDISSVLVDRLRQKYCDKKNLRIYRTTTPNDLPKRNKYNIVIAWNLFHHLHPKVWHQFLQEFMEKMKSEGILLISGWDKEDEVIKKDHKRARYTQHTTWYINDLPNHILGLPCEILENSIMEEKVPAFNCKRKFRFIIVKKVKVNQIESITKTYDQ